MLTDAEEHEGDMGYGKHGRIVVEKTSLLQ
jgi:hypothetical protein